MKEPLIDQSRRAAVVTLLAILVFVVGLFHSADYKRDLLERTRQNNGLDPSEVVAPPSSSSFFRLR